MVLIVLFDKFRVRVRKIFKYNQNLYFYYLKKWFMILAVITVPKELFINVN